MDIHIIHWRAKEILCTHFGLRCVSLLDFVCRKINTQVDLRLTILGNLKVEVKIESTVLETVIARSGVIGKLIFTVECSVRRKLLIERKQLIAIYIAQNDWYIICL